MPYKNTANSVDNAKRDSKCNAFGSLQPRSGCAKMRQIEDLFCIFARRHTMYKTIVISAAIVLAALALWLWRVMPDQGWVAWDGERYQIVAEGWAVLWRGWPLTLLGAVVGTVSALLLLEWLRDKAIDADHQQQIQRLTAELDAAKAATDAAKAEAEAALADDRAAVDRLRSEALRARDAAHEIQIRARREVDAAQALTLKASAAQKESALHAKNAIMTLRRKTGDLPANYRARRAKSEP